MGFRIRFNEEKNQLLQAIRGVGFEEVIEAIKEGQILDDISNPSKSRSKQRLYILKINQYVYAVPYVINEAKKEIFLKTIYPSRILTTKYLKKRKKRKEKIMKKPQPPVDTFANLILDEEEAQIEKDLELGLYVRDTDFEQTKLMLKEAAERYEELNKTKPVTLRVNQLDLVKIKAKAKRQKIPYQTLLSALIHEFAEGDIQVSL